MTVVYASEVQGPDFGPLTHGTQRGLTGYELAREAVGDFTATVVILGYWGKTWAGGGASACSTGPAC